MLDTLDERAESSPKLQFFRDIFVPAILSYVSLFVLLFVFGIALGIVFGPQRENSASAGERVRLLAQSFYGIQAMSLILYSGFYVLAERRTIAAGRPSLRELYKPVSRNLLVKSVGGGIGSAFLIVIAITLWSKLTATPLKMTPGEAGMMPGTQGAFDGYKLLRTLLSAFTIGLVGPWVEEIFFRGLLQRWLAQKMPAAAAVLTSAAIFALFHFKVVLHFNSWGVFLTVGIGCLGVVTGNLFHKHQSLWPGFAFHASYNLSLLVISLFGHH